MNTVGSRTVLSDANGRAIAADMREGLADNQNRCVGLPPEAIPGLQKEGVGVNQRTARSADGTPKQETKTHRYGGENEIMLRREQARRGISDPRWTTAARANWHNKESGVSQPSLKPGAEGVELVGEDAVVPAHAQHTKKEMGYDDKGNAVERQPGQYRYELAGKQADGSPKVEPVIEYHQKRSRETYVVYPASDANVANLGDRVAPGASFRPDGQPTARAKRWMENNGADAPDEVAVQREMVTAKLQSLQRNLSERHGVKIETDPRATEARFSIDKSGQPKLSVPEESKFEDLSHQVSSVALAVSHAHLAIRAKGLAERGQESGVPNEAAEARLKAYTLPPSKRASSPAYVDAELVATYAALNTTTGVGLEYRPPETTKDPAIRERWAKTLETPGGMAAVSRQIIDNTRSSQQSPPRQPRDAQAQERAQARSGLSSEEIRRSAAAAARKEMRQGGDPSVPQPSARPAAPTAQGPATRSQDRAGDR